MNMRFTYLTLTYQVLLLLLNPPDSQSFPKDV